MAPYQRDTLCSPSHISTLALVALQAQFVPAWSIPTRRDSCDCVRHIWYQLSVLILWYAGS
jgi:hypothetical protein